MVIPALPARSCRLKPDGAGCASLLTPSARPIRALLAGAVAAGSGATLLALFPRLELDFFARCAASIAALFTGAPVLRVASGWMLPLTGVPVVVTPACSATRYFLVVAALVSWQLARRGQSAGRAIVVGLGAALPLAIAINALRIVAVAQAHRWFIPLLPEAYGAFLHMLTGVAIFLPALISLNLVLEIYGKPRVCPGS